VIAVCLTGIAISEDITMIYSVIRNELGALEHVACPDLHFTADIERELAGVDIRAVAGRPSAALPAAPVAARSAPSTSAAPKVIPSQKTHPAPPAAAAPPLPQWLLDAAAVVEATPSRSAIAASWDRSFARAGANVRTEPPAADAWSRSFRRMGFALVGDPEQVSPASAPVASVPVSASASWAKSFARVGAATTKEVS
jgi:hypothetical protein